MADQNSFGEVLNQLGGFARSLSVRQKVTLGVGAIGVAATLFVFVSMIRKPEYKLLYSGMSAEDARSLASQLASKGIKHEISPDGTSVSVASDQIDKARIEVASQGPAKSGRMGFELFDKANWAATDFSEKVNYQRALEGELERTIQTLDGVQAVRVHLVLPEDSVFVNDSQEAKAAVTLKLSSKRYNQELHRAVASLVASAVEKLRPENVAIIDADTSRTIGEQITKPDGGGDSLEQDLASKLVRTLESVVGAQQVKASVRVEYDVTSGEENQETYDPNTVVTLATQKSEETSGGSAVAGVPGTASNVPGSQASQPVPSRNTSDSRGSRSESSTYAASKTLRHTIIPAGRVKRIAAALVIDDILERSGNAGETRRKRTPEEMKQIEEVARAVIGIDASRGDVLVVQNLSFQKEPTEQPVPPTRIERVRTGAREWAGAIRVGGIILLFAAVYVLLLRPIKKQAVLAFRDARLRLSGTVAPGKGKTLAANSAEAIAGDDVAQLSPESRATATLRRQLLDKVKNEPTNASRLVQSWIRESGGE